MRSILGIMKGRARDAGSLSSNCKARLRRRMKNIHRIKARIVTTLATTPMAIPMRSVLLSAFLFEVLEGEGDFGVCLNEGWLDDEMSGSGWRFR